MYLKIHLHAYDDELCTKLVIVHHHKYIIYHDMYAAAIKIEDLKIGNWPDS